MRNSFEEWKIVDCLFQCLFEICGYMVCVFLILKYIVVGIVSLE